MKAKLFSYFQHMQSSVRSTQISYTFAIYCDEIANISILVHLLYSFCYFIYKLIFVRIDRNVRFYHGVP